MKKFLKAILFSSLFVVMSAASVFAAECDVAISYADGEGQAVTELAVGETATMTMTVTVSGAEAEEGKLATVDIFYTMDALEIVSWSNSDANWTPNDGQISYMNFAGVDSATITATVKATEAGTASFNVIGDEESSAELQNGNDTIYVFNVTGDDAITVKSAELPKTDVSIANPTVEKSEALEDGNYHAGLLASFTVADTNNAVKSVKFVLNNGSKDAERVVDLNTTVSAGTVKVALNILNVDKNATITVKSVTPVAPAAN